MAVGVGVAVDLTIGGAVGGGLGITRRAHVGGEKRETGDVIGVN